jgi:hypothetical protein
MPPYDASPYNAENISTPYEAWLRTVQPRLLALHVEQLEVILRGRGHPNLARRLSSLDTDLQEERMLLEHAAWAVIAQARMCLRDSEFGVRDRLESLAYPDDEARS